MIVVMKVGTPEVELIRIDQELATLGLTPEKIVGKHKVVLGLVGDTVDLDPLQLQEISPWVEQVLRVEQPFKRASRQYRQGEASTVAVPTPNGTVYFGEHHPLVVVAGPCSVENEAMIIETAQRVKAAGAQFLRGGAFKPRTSPYAFQGHGESALNLLAAAREATGLGIITELMDAADLKPLAEVADVIQIGARNMQNFSLLKKVGGGRIAVHEIMVAVPAIRNLIREDKVAQMYSAIQTGQNYGMQTLDQNLLDFVKRGLVTKNQAQEYAKDKRIFD